ncbi:MAG: hypothetical protein GF405_01435 [Candidatus Eisenbacteria bacterium]|nr:hypothetical protein [Candidatus Eisenbacteria bacterium]
MARLILTCTIVLLIVGAAHVAVCVAAGSGRDEIHAVDGARRDTVLAWDDGSPGSMSHYISADAGEKAAVLFQAPAWADYVTRIRYFIMNDHEGGPIESTVLPFRCSVWASTEYPYLPQEPAVATLTAEEGFCEDCWNEVKFEPPVYVGDDTQFPDRVFFVGLEWLSDGNPLIGYDVDAPIDFRSYLAAPPPWQVQTTRDIMIRAIVDDSGSYTIRVPADVATIQEALDIADEGDTVLVAPGVYTGPGNRALDPHGKPLLVRAEGGRVATVIDCERLDRAFSFVSGEGPNTIVQGFTITNGLATGGGGLVCEDSNPRFIDCIFRGNEATGYGGAVAITNYLSSGGPRFEGCAFVENVAGNFGGGIYTDAADPVFTGCTIAANAAPSGGGLCVYAEGSPSLENTVIAHSTEGAAVYCGGSSDASLVCCDVYGNAGGDWTGCIEGLLGVEGNFSVDPEFCLGDNPDAPYALRDGSPCLAENSPCGELVGAFGQGCGENPVETTTWGAVKALFR